MKAESNVHVYKTIGSDVNRPYDWIFKQILATNSLIGHYNNNTFFQQASDEAFTCAYGHSQALKISS